MSSKKRLILTPRRCVVHVEVEHQEEMEMKMTRTMMKRMTKMLFQSQILTMMTKRRMMKIKTTETTKNSAKTPTKMSRMLLLGDANSLTCGQTCTVKKTLVKILNQRKCAADAVEEPRVVTVMKMKVTMMMKRMMMIICHQFQIQMMMMKTKTTKITRTARTLTMAKKIHMVMDVLSTLRTKCIVTMSSKKRLISTQKRCAALVEVEHQEEMEMKTTRTMMRRMTKMLFQSQILTMMTKRRMMKTKTTEMTMNSAKTLTKTSRMLLLVDANSLTCGQTCTVKKTLVTILNQRKCAADAVEEPRVVTVMKMKMTMMMKRMMMMACHQFQIQMMMMTKTKTMKITGTARTLTMAKKIHMVTDVHSIQKTKCIVMMTSEKRLISTLRRCAVHVVVELLEEMEMTTKKTMTITRQSQI